MSEKPEGATLQPGLNAEVELIGKASHVRFLIEEETFMEKVKSKRSKYQNIQTK